MVISEDHLLGEIEAIPIILTSTETVHPKTQILGETMHLLTMVVSEAIATLEVLEDNLHGEEAAVEVETVEVSVQDKIKPLKIS